MQFSENWLRTMVDPDLTSAELSQLLTMSGLEVEDMASVAPPFSGVVVARIVHVTRHPNADRLNICQVDVGTGDLLSIVCGASNVLPGIKVPCALVGACLPATQQGGPVFEIRKGLLRGVESQGMLCAARELGLMQEAGSGLMLLSDDAPVGRDLRDYLQLNDLTFTVKLTPNKADCLSVLGVAREVSALTGTILHQPTHKNVLPTLNEKLPVSVEAPDLCGRFCGRIIRHLNANVQTPEWMKQRLERSGQRSVSVLVDISNYVMLETGQPTHIFDLEKIHGGLVVRWGRQGESVELLNGITISVDDWTGIIADDVQVESLAGIMGGNATAVSLDTTDIYVEAAFWWPHAIQGRSRRYNFSTEAAHRFERGVDYEATIIQLERITSLIIEICGTAGTAVGVIDDQIVSLPDRKPVILRTTRASKIIGIPFQDEQIANIFDRLGLKHRSEPGIFTVVPPSYRFDIEIEEDLIEEVARVYGFDRIPALLPLTRQTMLVPHEHKRSLFKIRHQMANLDYQEAINFSFVDAIWEKDFANNQMPIRLRNPIASQMSTMRSSLIAGLIANVRYNINRKAGRVRMFEVGTVFARDDKVTDGPLSVAGYAQPGKIAAVAYGPVDEEQWGQVSRNVDFFDVKADIEQLFAPTPLQFVRTEHPALHPGRSAEIRMGGKSIGILGDLHPRLQQKYELPLVPIVFEMDVESLQQRIVPSYIEIAKQPAVTRDLAFIVKREVMAQDLLDTMWACKQQGTPSQYLQAIVLFDEYHGKGLIDGEKSLAFRFTLQDTLTTLQDETIDAAVAALIAAVADRHGAKLRS